MTKDAFRTPATLLLSQTTSCLFAHSTKAFVSSNPSVSSSHIFCIAFDQSTKPGDAKSLAESRLYGSSDWFETKELVDLGIGKRARGLVGLGGVSKFIVAALKADTGEGRSGEASGGDPMHLYGRSPGD